MKRFVICVAILVGILLQSVLSIFTLKRFNDNLKEYVTEAVYLAENKEYDRASEVVGKIEKYWEKYYKTASFLIQTSKLEEISFAVSKLSPLLRKGSEEFFSECDMIIYSTKQIYENELPRLSSVL